MRFLFHECGFFSIGNSRKHDELLTLQKFCVRRWSGLCSPDRMVMVVWGSKLLEVMGFWSCLEALPQGGLCPSLLHCGSGAQGHRPGIVPV